jgi:hypothetical protein
LAIWLTGIPAHGWAEPQPVSIELNKLEAVEGACRSFLVVENRAAAPIAALTLDLVVFDTEGVIAGRLAVDLAPVRADGMSVKAFDMADLDCAEIGRVLMNGVLACDAEGTGAPCAGPPAVSARGDVPFID